MPRGILLVNTGSPEKPFFDDVSRYLGEFLMDERVLDLPPLRRWLLVNLIIRPFRSPKTAEAYVKVWTPEGSPLLVSSRHVFEKLQALVKTPMALAMAYGKPSIPDAVKYLLDEKKVTEIYVIALFPHYAMATVESIVEKVKDLAAVRNKKTEPKTKYEKRKEPIISVVAHPPFYKDPSYMQALVASAQAALSWNYDHLLISYHGLPEHHLVKTDPSHKHCLAHATCCDTASPAHATCYRHQVLETTKLFVAKAGIPASKYSVAFQSRLGGKPWLKPYTDHELQRLAQRGVKKLLVLCPAFVTDCLETLEEIGLRGRDTFLAAGGEDLRLIPCLNEHPLWIQALRKWCGG